MSGWNITQLKKISKLNNPVFIEGLPGIGNVGKVAVDFMIDELKAEKAYDIFSYTFPHSVFVNDDNLVELPSISVYFKKFKSRQRDIIFLSGDVQPIDEVNSYEFTEKMLEIAKKHKCSEIITLGGIGMQQAPKKPKVYCTANNKKIIEQYKKGTDLNDKLYGVVGPIVGVSGLMIGMAEKKKINAISLLAETYGHPMYLGVKGAKEILMILNKKLNLKLNVEKLEKEVKELEDEMIKKSEKLSEVSKQTAIRKASRFKEMDYIG